MKNIYRIKLVLLAIIVASGGFLSSCDDDDETQINSGQVELLSFGPTGVQHGQKIKFIGRNLDKVESIEMTGATVTRAQFTSQTSEMIELVVPETATKGMVTLKLVDGEAITSKTILSFDVPVTVSSFTAQSRPGTNITITGNFLNWVDSVRFGSLDTTVTSFISQTMTELVLPVPMNAKSGALTLYTGGTEGEIVVTETNFMVTLPNTTSISPASIKHGENLTLTGTDLDLVQEIRFVGVGEANVTTFVSHTPTQIVVTVPNNASTGALILVTVNSLVEVPTTQTLSIILPTITTLSPNPVDPGATLTITGTNLDLVEEVVFTGGASASTFATKTATQIVLNVPMDALSGALTLLTQRNYTVRTSMMLTVFREREPYYIYDESINSAWQVWGGWGKSSEDIASTERVFRGTKAIKVSFNDAYGALQLYTTNPKVLEGYTDIVLRVYGTVDSRGAIQVKNSADVQTDDAPFDIKAGEWRTITISISSLGNNSGGIKEFYIKNYGTNPNTFYIDDIELK